MPIPSILRVRRRVRVFTLRLIVKMRSVWRAHVSPVFAPIPTWFRKLAWIGLFVVALTMVQINEYAIAEILLFLSGVALIIQVYDWKGNLERRRLTRFIRVFLAPFVVVVAFMIWTTIFIKIKG